MSVNRDPKVGDRRSLLDIALDHAVDGDNNVVVFRLDAGGGDYDFAELARGEGG